MKRLTIRNSDGSVSQPMDLKWAKALEKLADYEDTGLRPRDVVEIKEFLISLTGCLVYDDGGNLVNVRRFVSRILREEK